jgi:hypothetical protein
LKTMWSWVSVAEGANEASGLTRRAFRVRRKDEVWRRQEKHTHSEVAEGAMEGRNEPLSDWKAIVWGNGVAVLVPSPYLSPRAPALLCLGWLLCGGLFSFQSEFGSLTYPNPDPDLGFDNFVANTSRGPTTTFDMVLMRVRVFLSSYLFIGRFGSFHLVWIKDQAQNEEGRLADGYRQLLYCYSASFARYIFKKNNLPNYHCPHT